LMLWVSACESRWMIDVLQDGRRYASIGCGIAVGLIRDRLGEGSMLMRLVWRL
jgi:hypothetical protein